MVKITGIIAALNEASVIEDALKSLSFCDEIILVDISSTDETVKIAKKYDAKIIKGAPKGNYGEQRNQGWKASSGDWILYLDADERITPELKENILKAVNADSDINAYILQRKNMYLGNHPWPKIETFTRLFRKSTFKGWEGKLHESSFYEGKSKVLDGYFLHYTHRDLESMLDKTIWWSTIEAKLRHDATHPRVVWWRFFRVFVTGFVDSFFKQSGWKAGTMGLIESIYQGYSLFITYAKLWELQTIKK